MRLARILLLLLSVAGSLGVFCPNSARAQACCAAASAVAPGRLGLHERALVGVEQQLAAAIGSFDAAGHFYKNESGSHIIDTKLTLFSTARVVQRLQLGVTAPLVASFRRSANTPAETGWGLGDVGLNLRYDAVRNGEYRFLPGVGVVGGFTAPTGRAPDASHSTLGSDVTGLGVFQFSAGLWLEHSLGNWLLTGAALVGLRTASTNSGIRSQLAPRYSGLVALSYAFSEEFALAGTVTYAVEGDARIDGQRAPATQRRQTQLSVSASWTANENWRFLLSAVSDLPVNQLGKNQIATAGGNLTAIWSFL